MTLFYKGQKLTEIIILSVAITIAVVAMVVLKHSLWLILPYFLLEIGILYFYLNYGYIIENEIIIIKYGFIIYKKIAISSIYRIYIREKNEYAPKKSAHKIEIHYDRDRMQVVSPAEAVRFIENIEKIKPEIKIS